MTRKDYGEVAAIMRKLSDTRYANRLTKEQVCLFADMMDEAFGNFNKARFLECAGVVKAKKVA